MRLLFFAVFLRFISAVPKNDKVLRFSEDGTFKIAQFTDIHYGEGEGELWGPEQDRQSTNCMKQILEFEGSVDLAIFTGDLITGNNIYDNATSYWSQMLTSVNDTSTKFATLFGNHDDAPLEALTMQRLRTLNIISKQELQQYEATTYPNLSYTQAGPDSIHGVSNYYLLIYNSTTSNHKQPEVPMMVLYILDSNGGQLPEELYLDETDWLASTQKTLQAKYGDLPSLVFVHIPTPEYQIAYVPLSSPKSPCIGDIDLDSIDTTSGTNNLLPTILQPIWNNTCRGVTVGHDHKNDWICPYESLHLMFGRHSGYGGYSNLPRGSRIFNLRLDASARNGVAIDTYIRMESGAKLSLVQI